MSTFLALDTAGEIQVRQVSELTAASAANAAASEAAKSRAESAADRSWNAADAVQHRMLELQGAGYVLKQPCTGPDRSWNRNSRSRTTNMSFEACLAEAKKNGQAFYHDNSHGGLCITKNWSEVKHDTMRLYVPAEWANWTC